MWRKQEESPKAPSPSSPEVKPTPKVESAQVAAPHVAPSVPAAPPPMVASAPAGHLTSTLVIKGEITGREDLYIDGEVQGKIRLEEGRLTIGPNGRVSADVDAREIVVRGEVKGNLHARDRVQIGQTGRATGDVVTRRISIDEGAELRGRVEITKAEEPKPVAAKVNGAAQVAQPAALAVPAKETPASV